VLTKVISGGQNGVDQAGVEAAKQCGFQTGGTAPKGFITLDGPRPDLFDLYGIKEHPTRADYPPRTYENARDSDATIRLFRDPTTRGETLTQKAVDQYGKMSLDVDFRSPPTVKSVAFWIVKHDFTCVNIAGNSLRSSPGIYEEALTYLTQVFNEVKRLESLNEPSPESDPGC